jgi:hypothetical protein
MAIYPYSHAPCAKTVLLAHKAYLDEQINLYTVALTAVEKLLAEQSLTEMELNFYAVACKPLMHKIQEEVDKQKKIYADSLLEETPEEETPEEEPVEPAV